MRNHLRTILIGALTIGLMAFFLRHAELDRVWAAMRSARVDLLTLSLVITVATYLIRIERWRLLLRPVGHVSFPSAGRATTIGFAANSLVPGRVGEVLRPYVLARRESISGSAAFATVVVERLLDMLAIVFIVTAVVAGLDLPAADPQLLRVLQTGALVTGAAGVAGSIVMVLLARDSDRAVRVAAQLAALAPGGVGHVVAAALQRFLLGFAAVRRPPLLLAALGWSVILWVGIAASMWATTEAFGIHVPFSGAAVLMGMVAVGVSVPTPAGAGGYHAAYQLGATAFYGAGDDQAVGAALVMHMIAFGPVTVLGVVFMAQEGLRLGRLSDLMAPDPTGLGAAAAVVEPDTRTVARAPATAVAPTEDEGRAS